jgi:hypothetical protein
MIQVTLPASSGSTSVINYALNAPAIGASFPLTVDAGTILSGTVGAARLPAPSAYADAEATRMGLKQYVHGTNYNSGISPTVTGTNWTNVFATFIPYQLSDGTWRMKFNLNGTTSAATASLSLSVNGLLFKVLESQAVSVTQLDTTGGTKWTVLGRTILNTNQIQLVYNLAVFNHSASGEVELASKPTWAY